MTAALAKCCTVPQQAASVALGRYSIGQQLACGKVTFAVDLPFTHGTPLTHDATIVALVVPDNVAWLFAPEASIHCFVLRSMPDAPW